MSSHERHGDSITLAVTGASGAPYALRLLDALLRAGRTVYWLQSAAARVVMETEAGIALPDDAAGIAALLAARSPGAGGALHAVVGDDWFSPVASGSSAPRTMVVCPCSMGTLSAIAHGASRSLIERAADVAIKEGHRLVLVPRESPLSAIHLENMLTLARLGVAIVPAMPGFYHRPSSIEDLVDFVVARVLDRLGVAHDLSRRWAEPRD